jgi:hypothetical protein
MYKPLELHQHILQAVNASESIVASLQSGNLQDAEQFNDTRAGCIRAMSKCQNFESIANAYTSDLEKLSQLDKTILSLSNDLRDEVLTQICEEQTNRSKHVQYTQNQKL